MGKQHRRLKPGGPRKQYTSTKVTRMLNIHHVGVFKYHLKEIMRDSEMKDDLKPTFVANVLSKASRNSVNDAEDYVDALLKEGMLEGPVSEQIHRLLDQYSTRR